MVEAVRCLYMRAAIVELSKKHGKTERRYNEICQLFPAIKDNICAGDIVDDSGAFTNSRS